MCNAGGHVWPLRVEPEARGPRRGVRDRQGRGQGAAGARLQRRPHQAGVRRRASGPPTRRSPATSRARPSASCARCRWGLVPSWAKDPVDRQPDDQRPDGDGRREAGVPARRSPRGAACCRPTATSSGTPPSSGPRPASRSSSRSSSTPPTAACWRWPGSTRSGATPTRDEDDPERFLLDLHGAHHHGRGRRRPHPRPDAADGRARAVRRLARPGRHRRRRPRWRCWCPPRPAGWRRTRSSHRRSTTSATTGPSWSSRSPPSRGAAVMATTADGVGARRRTATPGCTRPRRGARSPRCCSATAPAAASTPADLARWPRRCPRKGITVVRVEQPWRVAGKKVAPAPGDARRRASSRPPTGCGRAHPAGRRRPLSAGARSAARTRPPARRVRRAWRWPSRCTRPGRPEKSRLDELTAAGGADPGGPGRARPVRDARGVPATTVELAVVPAADHGFKVPKAGAAHRRRRRWRSSSRRRWSGWSATSSGILTGAGRSSAAAEDDGRARR